MVKYFSGKERAEMYAAGVGAKHFSTSAKQNTGHKSEDLLR